jgi:putative transposase
MSRRAPAIVLSPRQQAVLDRLSRSRTLAKRSAERVLFVLWSADGQTCAEQAKRMDVDPQRSRRWRKRWFEAQERFAGAEAKNISDDEYEVLLCEELADEKRSGAPPKFSAEQLAQLITLACKEPKDLGLPVTHWTPSELAREAVKAGIVTSISPRHIARFFGGGRDSTAQVKVLAQPPHRRSGEARKAGGGRLRRLS